MNEKIKQLEPQELWNNFAQLNAIPRASKKEERVIAFIKTFGENLGLETLEDEVGNVIIKKPATTGYENAPIVVLQSHLDMVHQKNNDTIFDFNTQGIEMYVDGDWVRAKGTTLGADNGLGVAAIMSILASKTIAHPALEALFTIDEETGMTGAMGLKGGLLHGEILLNLDTEHDTEIDIGCAGGIDVTAQKEYISETIDDNKYEAFTITVKGLNGGHSGMEIHKGLGNANKIMNRILYNIQSNANIRIASINGGSLRNAIPRESVAEIWIKNEDTSAAEAALNISIEAIIAEYYTVENNLNINIIKTPNTNNRVLPSELQQQLIACVYTAHNGVYRMSSDFDNLVETSNNIAKVTVGENKINIQCLTRSSVETSKIDLANALKNCFELMGATVTFSGDYPGWKPNSDSKILKVLTSSYKTLFKEEANVVACHAGLECGILGRNYPNMDMISFGPTIEGAHSPDERASISSAQKFWKFLIEILQNIK